MAENERVGSVAELWRFPVKSMRGERLEEAELEVHGLLGDRAYALIDRETSKVVSAKSVRLFPDLLDCAAEFVRPPQSDREFPAVRITLPNGTSVESGSSQVDRELSAYFGRDVTLARSAPADYTIDIYDPDVEEVDPTAFRDAPVEQKRGAVFFDQAGTYSPVPAGSFFDLFPVSVMSTATLERLRELRPESQFEQRRFRMNAMVNTDRSGFPENDWVGHQLTIGDAARLRVTMPDARCVMTTLAQGDLPQDTEVIRTLVQHNRLQVGDGGRLPCAGVYAVVAAPGTVRLGDRVALG